MVLPADILLLIAEELGAQHDFESLFHCALAGKHFAGSALLCLYRSATCPSRQQRWLISCRIHNDYLRIISSEDTDAKWNRAQVGTRQKRTEVERKWALIWRSIIRSSLGTTAYPYALYILSLDLNNLADLLDDNVFKLSIMQSFFAEDMQRFLSTQDTPVKHRTRNQRRLDTDSTVNLVGDSISKFVNGSSIKNQTTVALESFSGNIGSTALASWTPGMKRLRTLRVWDGSAVDGEVAAAISQHCFNFDDFSIFSCRAKDRDGDSNLASFLSGLRPNTLRSFTIQSSAGLGENVLNALNGHSLSLKVIKLGGLYHSGMKHLSRLQDCKLLEVLEVENRYSMSNLEATENDVYVDVLAWLKQCSHLQEVSFTGLPNAPEFVTAICLQDNVKLRDLKVVKYTLADNQTLHHAISNQASLESLSLRADPESSTRDDIDTLISCICFLPKLKELDLLETSDYFNTPEIRRLAQHLPNLEKFIFAGLSVTNDVLPAMSGLHHLRDLNINAVTSFSVDGLLNYISTLLPTNQGLCLSVFYQSPEYQLSDEDRVLIQESISAKVDGKFEFSLSRDRLDSDYDDSDSD